MSLRIVFMGSPEFALPSLRALAAEYQVVGVVTQPDRAAGRGHTLKQPPVKTLALELGLPIMQPEKLRAPEAAQQLRDWSPDLIVVAAYGQILKPDILNLPRHGCLNVHASLLPRWRGAAPINAAILAGDEETGVTIMQMDTGLDTGAMLAKKLLRISADLTAGALTQTLSTLGADLLRESLPDILAGKLIPMPQDNSLATYAPQLKKEDGRLDFARPAAELERRVRAMSPWPGAWFEWAGGPLKVGRVSIVSGNQAGGVATRFTREGRPAVQTSEGALVLEEVQPAGKKAMSGKSFLAGARDWAS